MYQNSIPQIKTNEPGNTTLILIITCTLTLVIAFMTSALNVALPVINHDFKADAILLSWIVAGYTLAMAIFSVPFGRIADIVGIKKLFLIGNVIIILSSSAVIFADSVIFLIIIRLVMGMGGAILTSTGLAMITASFTGKQRGRALGIYTAFIYAGISVGPFFGGILTERLSWKAIFLVPIPVSLFALFVALWKIKSEWVECKGEKFDYIGSFIYGLSLATMMYGFSLLPEVLGGIITVIGIAGIIGFLIYENNITSPILNVIQFRNNRGFIFSNLASLISYTAISAIAFLISLYLQYIKGFNAELAGLVLITQPVVQTILSPFAGRLSDKIQTRIVASIGMAMVCLGLISFTFLANTTSVVLIIINIALIGAGFALFSAPNINAIMSSVKPQYYAVASSVSNTTRSIGQSLSIGICMIVMAIIIGRVVIGPDNYQAFLTSAKIAFGVFAFLCFLGVFASLSRGSPNKD